MKLVKDHAARFDQFRETGPSPHFDQFRDGGQRVDPFHDHILTSSVQAWSNLSIGPVPLNRSEIAAVPGRRRKARLSGFRRFDREGGKAEKGAISAPQSPPLWSGAGAALGPPRIRGMAVALPVILHEHRKFNKLTGVALGPLSVHDHGRLQRPAHLRARISYLLFIFPPRQFDRSVPKPH